MHERSWRAHQFELASAVVVLPSPLPSAPRAAEMATFEEGADGCTNVTLTISYTLPNVARPIVSRNWPQRFVRRTMLWTMETFRDALEAEAATMEASADAEAPSESAEAAAIDAAEDLSEAKL